jgi:hypothetical protein
MVDNRRYVIWLTPSSLSRFRQSFDRVEPHSRLEIASGMENVEGMDVKEKVTNQQWGA